MTLSISPYLEEHLPHIVRNLREIDKLESRGICKRSAFRSIRHTLNMSYKAITILDNDTPVGLLSVALPSGPIGPGVVSFVGTKDAYKFKVQFIKMFVEAISHFFDIAEELQNFILKDNVNAYNLALRFNALWPQSVLIEDFGRIIRVTIKDTILSEQMQNRRSK